MTFSTNQNRQFYVAKALQDSSEDVAAVGDIAVGVIGDECDKEVFFTYMGADTVLKSDRIPVKNINYVKKVTAADMVTPLKKVEVALADGTSLIAGEDYVLRIAFRQFYGMSDQDQYFKDAAVHCTAAMVSTPANFWTAMANALNLAFSREVGASKTSNPYLTFTAASTKLTITEKEQPWNLGTDAQERVYFEIFPTTVYDGGDDIIWGKVTDVTPTKANAVVGTTGIGNGKKIADLEYFCMGERGDQYRNIGWPNVIPTKYLVDPSKQYDVLEIHFAFTDTGVNSYRSEKDITIVTEGGDSSILDDLYDAFMEAAGLAASGSSESEGDNG